ncbi:peptide ABC transporter substrate-binding protein [Suttonella ornithocola]|uniref:peptide ABC transporter substrate-binding protein n=1 Tax=Suttonella ornithocola TaxID=279832 RepID=UPI000B2AA687|nr:peptide ABC transporter substrate-binding protein [Suttonella ornithocola]
MLKRLQKEKKKNLDTLGVKALDDHTLQVTLNHPTPYFLGMLVNAVTYPVPKAVVEKYGKEWTKPEHMVSNGAFTLSDWQPQAQVTLSKSSTYYGADKVSLDKVIYYPTEEQSAAFKRYRAGELDFTSDIPSEQLQWANEHLKDEVKISPYLGTFYYGFNLTKPPFKDNPKLREALTLAVDRVPITDKITAAGEVPTTSFVVEGIEHYTPYVPEYTKFSNEERLARAKKAYAEAGYSKANPLKVELLYNTNENNKKISIALAAMWKQALGVETKLVNKEWKSYLTDRRNYDTQLFRGSWIGDYNDANTFLDLFVTGGGSNTVGLDDPKYNQLIAEAAKETNTTKRAELLHQAEKRLLDNYSLIPIYNFVSKHMVKSNVSGYVPNVMDHWQSKYITINQ